MKAVCLYKGHIVTVLMVENDSPKPGSHVNAGGKTYPVIWYEMMDKDEARWTLGDPVCIVPVGTVYCNPFSKDGMHDPQQNLDLGDNA